MKDERSRQWTEGLAGSWFLFESWAPEFRLDFDSPDTECGRAREGREVGSVDELKEEILLRYTGVMLEDKGEEETPEILVGSGFPSSNVVPMSGVPG